MKDSHLAENSKKSPNQREGESMSWTYSTSDFPMAAFFLAKGEKMASTRKEGRRVIFEFANVQACKDLAKRYMLGDDEISAYKLHEASKRLKFIIHDVMENKGDRDGKD